MNRTRTTLAALGAAALLLAGLLIASPAHADPTPCNTVPALPGECLTDTVYTYLLNLQAERDDATTRYADARQTIGALREEHNQALLDLWQAGLDRQHAEQQASIAQGDLAVAYDWIDHQATRIKVLHAKVRELRHLLDEATP